MASILIIEPDKDLENFLKDFLVKKGHETKTASQGSESLSLIDKYQPDLLILDRNVTDVRGESVCWEVKKEYPELPVILLVEEPEVKKIKKLYRAGADDFISKPINTDWLLSRVEIHLTDQRNVKNVHKMGDLSVNTKTFQVKRNKKNIKLTPQEFKLLKFLVKNKGRVLSRELILSRVWGYNADVQSRAVDVYVGYLRKKIDGGFKKKLIKTVRGFGYMLKG